MNFGNRFGECVQSNQANWTNYLVALEDMRFFPSEPIFRTFVGEVFHDSKVELEVCASSSSAVLKCTNVFALDKFANLVEERHGLARAAFLTKVHFKGVSNIEVTFDENICLQGHCYGYSEISRYNSLTSVLIELSRMDHVSTPGGSLKIVAKQVEIEDLTSSLDLQRILKSKRLNEDLFYPIAYLEDIFFKANKQE